MFKIADSRDYFYQWDIDRQIIVDDPTIKEVHFCNRTDECSLVVEVVNRLANVPNVILQRSFDVRVFGYDGKATRYDEVFKVKARSKPSDYVYTEVEIKRYEDLSKRIDKIEEEGISEEVIVNAVNEYLEENPVGNVSIYELVLPEAGNVITDEKTIELLENAWSTDTLPLCSYTGDLVTCFRKLTTKVYLTAAQYPVLSTSTLVYEYDLQFERGHSVMDTSSTWTFVNVTKTDRRWVTKTSELENNSGYATEDYVDNAIANIDIPEGGGSDCRTYFFDVNNYEWSENSLENPNYAPAELVEFAEKFLAGESVALYVTSESGHWLPAQFASLGSTSLQFTRSIANRDIGRESTIMSYRVAYVTGRDGNSYWTVNNYMQSTKFIADKTYVDEAIANIEIPEADPVDLTNYYTKEETNTAITNSLSNYATKAWVSAKGYTTAEDVNSAIQTALSNIGVAEGGSY